MNDDSEDDGPIEVAAHRTVTMLASRSSFVIAVAVVLLAGCDSVYKINGKVVVARGAPHTPDLPAVLCIGKGGPLDSSAVDGHPAYRTGSQDATIFCGPVPDDVDFELDETIVWPRPPHAYVYAWLAPVSSAKSLCTHASGPTVRVDERTLDHLMSPEDADKPPGERAPVTRPCGRNPTPSMPMTSAVTFDPAHKTWSDKLVEQRTLRVE